MRIAVPVAQGRLCMHFGHCEEFHLLDVDPQRKTITSKQIVKAPDHQPGLLPPWLHEKGANVVIAGGMGGRARDLFAQRDIKVIVGAPAEEPEKVVRQFLDGTLKTGENVCDH